MEEAAYLYVLEMEPPDSGAAIRCQLQGSDSREWRRVAPGNKELFWARCNWPGIVGVTSGGHQVGAGERSCKHWCFRNESPVFPHLWVGMKGTPFLRVFDIVFSSL